MSLCYFLLQNIQIHRPHLPLLFKYGIFRDLQGNKSWIERLGSCKLEKSWGIENLLKHVAYSTYLLDGTIVLVELWLASKLGFFI